jgi:hypothetical protein
VGVDERGLEDLRSLAARDAELEAQAAGLRLADAEIAAIRREAEAIDAFFEAYPANTGRAAEAVRDATAELERRREELEQAEADLAAAADDDARVHAEQAVVRARDHIAVAQARLDRELAEQVSLDARAGALPAQLPALEARARALADVPPPDGDLVDWASRAHAEVFVALGQLDVQRDRVIREANELATMLLGEPTYGSTVAQALRQAESLRG